MADIKFPLWLQKGHTAVYFSGIGIVLGIVLGYLVGVVFGFDVVLALVFGGALGLIVGALLDVWALKHDAPER